jgi:hypothetical protein
MPPVRQSIQPIDCRRSVLLRLRSYDCGTRVFLGAAGRPEAQPSGGRTCGGDPRDAAQLGHGGRLPWPKPQDGVDRSGLFPSQTKGYFAARKDSSVGGRTDGIVGARHSPSAAGPGERFAPKRSWLHWVIRKRSFALSGKYSAGRRGVSLPLVVIGSPTITAGTATLRRLTLVWCGVLRVTRPGWSLQPRRAARRPPA